MEGEVLLTNDDGVHSAPFRAFWISLLEAKIGRVIAVVPEHEMSAAGKGLTLNKPLRIRKLPVKVGGFGYREVYTVSGTPGDTVTVALRFIMNSTPELVVSGINIGDNITLDNIFTSGTIAAALQATLMGIRSAAFSVEVPGGQLSRPVERFMLQARIAAKITEWILRRGLPEGVDLLNVNFPYRISADTPIRITKLGRVKYENYVLERMDTRGDPYYWLGGNPVPVSEKDRGTDLYALTVERAISITPISLDLSVEILDCDDLNRKRKEALEELSQLSDSLTEFLGNISNV